MELVQYARTAFEKIDKPDLAKKLRKVAEAATFVADKLDPQPIKKGR